MDNKKIGHNFVITCPLCGFSFKAFNKQSEKKAKVCPMCGYKFYEPNIFPKDTKEFNKKFL